MKPTTEWQARVWGFTGRMTPNESAMAIRDLRGDTVIPGQHPRVILSQCVPLKKKGKRGARLRSVRSVGPETEEMGGSFFMIAVHFLALKKRLMKTRGIALEGNATNPPPNSPISNPHTPNESAMAIRDLRGDTVIPRQHPRVILSQCVPLKKKGKR